MRGRRAVGTGRVGTTEYSACPSLKSALPIPTELAFLARPAGAGAAGGGDTCGAARCTGAQGARLLRLYSPPLKVGRSRCPAVRPAKTSGPRDARRARVDSISRHRTQVVCHSGWCRANAAACPAPIESSLYAGFEVVGGAVGSRRGG